jgi:hypothetical protein
MAQRRNPIPVELTNEQLYELERLWFVYGNHGSKTTPGNHGFIQGLIERYQDERQRGDKFSTPTPECEAAVEAILAGQISTDGLSDTEKAVRTTLIKQWAQRVKDEKEWLARTKHQREGNRLAVSDAPKEKSGDRRGLKLINLPEQKPPLPDPELKVILDDMKRRYRVQREREGLEPDGKDAA